MEVNAVWLELFLLDNAVMNALMLRAAAAMCSAKVPFWRMFCFSLGGAVYAAFAFSYPFLGTLTMKLVTGLLMALCIPVRTVRAYLHHALSVFFAAFLSGGLCICLALVLGGSMKNGVLLASFPLRAALLGALGVSFLPRALRYVLARNAKNAVLVRLRLCYKGKEYLLDGIVDTGNLLTEPISALPVIVFYTRDFIGAGAGVPVLVRGAAGGNTILYAFKPDALYDCSTGTRLNALAALAPAPLKGASALVPPAALSAAHTE
ncbi:MAG TPA: sigma-E processing peptidase SpoIIGA [Clostridia bacterium]|nr:sigma-E processing peptidase SpoIIGA [Clostridia bacterium]